MINEPPDHLKQKYRLYAISLDSDYGSRPISDLIIVHVGRPVSYETFCETYIFNNRELTVEKTNDKIPVGRISGIQKIDNKNTPRYEITMDGILREIK